jgi:hypothetical protein
MDPIFSLFTGIFIFALISLVVIMFLIKKGKL